MRKEKYSQIFVSSVSQREFTFPCLSKLSIKYQWLFSRKNIEILCFLEPGAWIGYVISSFTLRESISGLIIKGREKTYRTHARQ